MTSVRSRLVLLCAAAQILGGCVASPNTDALLADPGALPRQAMVGGVSFQSHVDDGGAPGALAMALGWSGLRTQATALVPGSTDRPSRDFVVQTVNRHGRVAYPVNSLRALLLEVAAGHPVLTLQEPSGGAVAVWRYALVVGYDLKRGTLTVHSGVIENMKLPISVFERNWQRAENWAVVVLPPERMPATATEGDYLTAAQRLVANSSAWEAVVAHDSALSAWPRSAAAMAGLARSLRALGDEDGAETVAMAASSRDVLAGRRPAPVEH